MKRATQIILGAAVVCLVAAIVVTETGLGGPPNDICPALRTDPFGFPLFPPYSEYPNDGNTQTGSGIITVLKENLPCCGVFAADGTFTLVPADGVLERCLIPSVQVFQGETCPALVDITLTLDAGGAVRNCLAPNPDSFGGGGSLFMLTGNNAG